MKPQTFWENQMKLQFCELVFKPESGIHNFIPDFKAVGKVEDPLVNL